MKAPSTLLVTYACVLVLFIALNIFSSLTKQSSTSNLERATALVKEHPLSQKHWLNLAAEYQASGLTEHASKALTTAASLSQNNITLLHHVWERQLASQDYLGATRSAKRLLQINPKDSYDYFLAMTSIFSVEYFVENIIPKQDAPNSKGTNIAYLTKLMDGAVTAKNAYALKNVWRNLSIDDRNYIASSPEMYLHYHNYLRSKDFDTIYDMSIASENSYLFRGGEFTLPFDTADADNPFCWIINQHPSTQWQSSGDSITISASDNLANKRHNMTCFLPTFLLTPSLINIETRWNGKDVDKNSAAVISIEPRFSKRSEKKAPVTRVLKSGTWSDEVIKQEQEVDMYFFGFNVFISPPQPAKMKTNSKNQISLTSFLVTSTPLKPVNAALD